MSSDKGFVDYVVEQLRDAGSIRSKKMFGEYGLYCDGKYFAAVCDGRLLIKITPAGAALWPGCPRDIPYEGGGEMFLPDVDDRERLAELARVTCAALPDKRRR